MNVNQSTTADDMQHVVGQLGSWSQIQILSIDVSVLKEPHNDPVMNIA